MTGTIELDEYELKQDLGIDDLETDFRDLQAHVERLDEKLDRAIKKLEEILTKVHPVVAFINAVSNLSREPEAS